VKCTKLTRLQGYNDTASVTKFDELALVKKKQLRIKGVQNTTNEHIVTINFHCSQLAFDISPVIFNVSGQSQLAPTGSDWQLIIW